jgi:hypothetical protein
MADHPFESPGLLHARSIPTFNTFDESHNATRWKFTYGWPLVRP